MKEPKEGSSKLKLVLWILIPLVILWLVGLTVMFFWWQFPPSQEVRPATPIGGNVSTGTIPKPETPKAVVEPAPCIEKPKMKPRKKARKEVPHRVPPRPEQKKEEVVWRDYVPPPAPVAITPPVKKEKEALKEVDHWANVDWPKSRKKENVPVETSIPVRQREVYYEERAPSVRYYTGGYSSGYSGGGGVIHSGQPLFIPNPPVIMQAPSVVMPAPSVVTPAPSIVGRPPAGITTGHAPAGITR